MRGIGIFRSVQIRMTAAFILVSTIPLMILGLHLMSRITDRYVAERVELERSITERLVDNLAAYLNEHVNLAQLIYFDDGIAEFLSTEYATAADSAEGFFTVLEPRFSNYRSLYSDVSTLVIYTGNPTTLTNGSELDEMESFPFGTDGIAAIRSQLGLITWVYTDGPDPELTLLRVLNQSTPGPTGDLLAIGIRGSALGRFLVDEESDVVVAAPNGTVVSSTRPEWVGREMRDTGLIFDETTDGLAEGKLGESTVSIIAHEFDLGSFARGRWRVVKILDMDELSLAGRPLRMAEILSLATIVAVSLVIGVSFSLLTGSRIRRLTRGMERLQDGRFDVRLPVKSRDEIGVLTESFNTMSGKLEDLVNRVYRYELEEKELALRTREAELNALQNQINPHFLFNTIDSILMELDHDPSEAGQMLVRLASFYRRNLKLGHHKIHLADELALVEDYVALQQFRFGERIRWALTCDDTLHRLLVPRLILQPVVENAIIHGIGRKTEGGSVTLSIEAREGELWITVRDDGIGMPAELLARLRASVEHPDPASRGTSSVGLANIAARLQRLYGGSGSLSIAGRLGEGTEVEIRIPMEDGTDV